MNKCLLEQVGNVIPTEKFGKISSAYRQQLHSIYEYTDGMVTFQRTAISTGLLALLTLIWTVLVLEQ